MTDTAAAQPGSKEWRNLFGVCAAIGEDLGFDPLWLRIAYAVPLIWHPAIVLSAYAAAGLVVLISRLAYPARRAMAPSEPITLMPRIPAEPLPPLAKAA